MSALPPLPLFANDQTETMARDLRPLRDYQAQAIADLRQALRMGRKRPVLQLPTGGGKTAVAGNIIRMALAKGNAALFVVPALSLIDQTVQSFWRDGLDDVGVIQADHPLTNPEAAVQVASVQSLMRRFKPKFGLAIVDECHVQHQKFLEWIGSDGMKSTPVIGLSATPWSRGLGKHYDHLIVASTTAQMIEAGYLSPFRVYAPSHPDLSGVRTQAGDYHEGDLGKAMNKPMLVADVVETWIKLGEGRPTLCFAVDCAHAKALQERFQAAGVPCGYIDAYTERADRDIIGGKLERGELKVICNVGCLTTGVDWDVRCIILARPTKSEILFTQIVGRGLRLAAGKRECVLLDHSDTHSRLGFVTDIHHETLDDDTRKGKSERKIALPKECPKCHNLRPPQVTTCPNCGFVVTGKRSKIEADQGDLKEITRGKGGKSTGPANHLRFQGTWIHLRDFYAQLKTHAARKCFKPGWAANKYREAAGTWPNAYRDVDLQPICPEVESWLIAQQIRWAKARSKADPEGAKRWAQQREAEMCAPASATPDDRWGCVPDDPFVLPE